MAEQYGDKTELDQREKQAGLIIRNRLLCEPEGTVNAWISPSGGPENYEEGRITVGVSKRVNGLMVLDSYGIPTNFTAEANLFQAWRLAEHSPYDYKLDYPEDLRDQVIIFKPPNGDSPWQILRDAIPLNEAWDAIESKSVKQLKVELDNDAAEVVHKVMPLIEGAQTQMDYIRAGAQAEQLMQQKHGRALSGVCGSTNSDILNRNSYTFSFNRVSTAGVVETIHTERGRRVENCGNCGRGINKLIKKGYQCKCGEVYKGC